MIFFGIAVLCLLIYLAKRPSAPVSQPTPVVTQVPQNLGTNPINIELEQKLKESLIEVGRLQQELEFNRSSLIQTSSILQEFRDKFDKLQHQKKSSEVRTGTFVEILSPIAEAFPVNPKTMRFLGSPIDYISFDYETEIITFVEVKSGDSQLNENQRKVRDMIKNKRVEFKIVRLDEKGIRVK